MKKILLATLIVILVVPSLFFVSQETSEISDLAPFTPHEVKVLVVSPADIYSSGAHYLVADLARYGFNITHHASDDALATDYLADPRTSDLSRYDVVILHGIKGYPPSEVSIEEVNHFTNYTGILIVIGNALIMNKTGAWLDPTFSSEPILTLEQRLGVDFTGFLGAGGAWHNSGTFTSTNSSIKGLPSSLSYVSSFKHNDSISFQLDLTTNGAGTIYNFSITSSPSTQLINKTTPGVTYYQSQNGVGIFVQGAYIYGVQSGTNQISYFGLTDISKRSSLLASLIAFALKRDINTIIKPQPLATVRLDNLGGWGWTQTYLNTSLSNFNSIVETLGVTPTIRFTDLPDFNTKYWTTEAPEVLSELQGEYRQWEYSSSLRGKNTSLMTPSEIEALIQNIRIKYDDLKMDQFSTITTAPQLWRQPTLSAMAAENLSLIDSVGELSDLPKHSSSWWSTEVSTGVIVHYSVRMAFETVEYFNETSKDFLHYRYFSNRDKWALAVVNGFPGFVYYVPNFRWNEVGTYSLQTVSQNLTSEIPDILFVPLMEAGLYFGNKWMRIENASRAGTVIEFDIDASAIPSVVSIEKGMLWLKINANESTPIQEVSIDNESWFYFDDHSIRIPAPTNSVHVKVTLGTSPNPRVVGTKYKVLEARYDGYRLNVSISSAQGLNLSVRLFLPQVGSFLGGNWSLYSPQDQWSYKFDVQSRILEFWAISEGFVTFEVGIFFSIEQTLPWYNSIVTVTVNTADLKTSIQEVILSYYISGKWFNVTMRPEGGLYVAGIPMMPYGTIVQYQVFVLDAAGHRLDTAIVSYKVIDQIPPEIGVPTWNPLNPDANQYVSVNVSVTEPENASGISNVVLWYYLDDVYGLLNAKSVNMTQVNDVWSAVIPAQSGGASVNFVVQASDKAGNMKQTIPYGYQVARRSAIPFQIVLLGLGLGTVVGVGMILYFVKFRKTKNAN